MMDKQDNPPVQDDVQPVRKRRAVRETKEEIIQGKDPFEFLQENRDPVVVKKEKPQEAEEDEDDFDFSFLSEVRESLKDEEVAGEYVVREEQQKEPEPVTVLKEVPKSEPVGAKPLFDRMRAEIKTYNEKNTGVFLDTATFKYCDGVAKATMKDDAMLLPIRKVYLNGREVRFDRVGEVRIPEDADVELDLGVSVIMPDNVGLVLSTAPEAEKKFGITVKTKTVLRRQDALFPIVVKMSVLDTIAYVSKYHGVVEARFLPV